MRVVVGRLGRPHGIRGDITVEVRTDEPDRRFVPGATMFTDSDAVPSVVLSDVRWHSGRMLVAIEGIDDRTAAEGLRGLLLEVEVADDEVPDGDDEYYDRQLVGLRAETVDGEVIGVVRSVVHLPGHDLLAVERDGAPEVLIPFVAEVVPTVDLRGERVVVAAPPGLLDTEES